MPKQVWQFPNVHVDGSCVVADGKLFVGSVMGDVYKDFCALAVDVGTGKEIWRVSAPMPLPASPAYTAGRVYFGLGNGKFDLDARRSGGGRVVPGCRERQGTLAFRRSRERAGDAGDRG